MEKEQQDGDYDHTSSSMTDVDKEPNISEQPDLEKPSGDSATAPVEVAEPEHNYVTGIKLILVLASVTLICFLMLLDMSIVVTAIPQITSDFHSLPDVGWYGSVYLLANCAFQPFTGKIYSNFSSKYTFLSFLGLFELGSVLCGAARSSNMLIIGRAVAGLGASGLVNGALTIMGASVPMHKRPVMMGIMMSVGQIGIVLGPLIGGVLTQYASWRWCFFINLPIGALGAIFLLLIKIPDNIKKTTEKATILTTLSKLDLFGFALFAPLAVMLLMALEWGGTKYAWNSATVIGLFCGAAGMFVVFLAWEHHVGEGAMIPFFMVRKKVVWSSCLTIGFFFGSLMVFSYYLPIYFQAVKGVSPSLSGVYILPSILTQMMAAIISGVLVGKLGYYLPWSVASGVLVAISSGLMSTFEPDTPTAKWVGYQIIAGLGRGCGMQMPVVAIQNVLLPEQIPVGMSLVVFSQTFGGTLFLTFAQLIFSHELVDGLKKFAPTVDPQTVINAGATAFRKAVKPEEIPGILQAYNAAINRDFYLAAGAGVGTFVFCWGMGWRSIKKKKEEVTPEVVASEV